jgi:uncharacterized protein YkwD
MNNIKLYTILLIALLESMLVSAQQYDNIKREYIFQSLTEANAEAKRTQRSLLADYQPTGLNFMIGNKKFTIDVAPFDTVNYQLRYLVGFKPLWYGRNKQTEGGLHVGVNDIAPPNEGLLFITFVKRKGWDNTPASVKVKISGGTPVPFFYLGKTSPAQFKQQIDSLKRSDYVQLASDKVMITIPYEDYIKSPARNLTNTFDTLHKVIDWENECAGFEGSSREHSPTRLRLHYVVDTYNRNGDGYYMYATAYQIGMLRSNFTELIHPELLCKGWGIWHETGHTNQQPSWKWKAVTEISVNIFSLYVQEKFELPSVLNKPDGFAKGVTIAENIKNYMASPDKDYNAQGQQNLLFTKMFMFWQLKENYGWQLIRDIHRYFRENPAEGGTDQDKADRFIYAVCFLTKSDLRPFFLKWGLKPADNMNSRIDEQHWPFPKNDLANFLVDRIKPKQKNCGKIAADFLAKENEARLAKKLPPLRLSPFLSEQSLLHCKEMQQAGGYTWGNYQNRNMAIREKLGYDCNPMVSIFKVENTDNATDFWDKWLAEKKDGGGVLADYNLTGISILQDNIIPDKFYIAQYFAKELPLPSAQQLMDSLLTAENEHRKRLELNPLVLNQELINAADALSNDMFVKKGLTYGDYGARARDIKNKLGQHLKVEFHITVSGTGSAKTIADKWFCADEAPRRNIDGPYQYTGFGIHFDKGKYYIAQYFAYDSTIK